MRAGMLRHQVEVWDIDESRYSSGTYAETPVEAPQKIWAAIEPVSGDEPFIAQQVTAETTHKVTVRYDTITEGIVPRTHYLMFGTRKLNILAARNIRERGVELLLLCREAV